MSLNELVPLASLIGFIITAFFTVAKVGWIVKESIDNIKADYSERFAEMEEKHEGKHARIYERFDEYKNHLEKDMLPDYVRKDLWNMHSQTLESTLKDVIAHVALTDRKIDDLRDLIIKTTKQ